MFEEFSLVSGLPKTVNTYQNHVNTQQFLYLYYSTFFIFKFKRLCLTKSCNIYQQLRAAVLFNKKLLLVRPFWSMLSRDILSTCLSCPTGDALSKGMVFRHWVLQVLLPELHLTLFLTGQAEKPSHPSNIGQNCISRSLFSCLIFDWQITRTLLAYRWCLKTWQL